MLFAFVNGIFLTANRGRCTKYRENERDRTGERERERDKRDQIKERETGKERILAAFVNGIFLPDNKGNCIKY